MPRTCFLIIIPFVLQFCSPPKTDEAQGHDTLSVMPESELLHKHLPEEIPEEVLVEDVDEIPVEENGQSILLLGLNCDNSPYGMDKYGSFQHEFGAKNISDYRPYKTIAIIRNGNKVYPRVFDFIIIPTDTGFLYATQKVNEVRNEKYDTIAFEKHYNNNDSDLVEHDILDMMMELSWASYTVAISDRKPRKPGMHASFKEATNIDFESLSFVNPDFYMVHGHNAYLKGGAQMLGKGEGTKLYAISEKMKPNTNELIKLIPRSDYIAIVKRAACTKEYMDTTYCNDDAELPWNGPIKEHEWSYLSFEFENGKVYPVAMVSLRGNSSNSFLEPVRLTNHPKLLRQFGLKGGVAGEPKKHEHYFESPGKKTEVIIDKGILKVRDKATQKILLTYKLPRYNRVIMAEWGVGETAKRWEAEF